MDGNGGSGFLFLVWSTSGYTLIERAGDPPRPGTEVEDGDDRYRVAKTPPRRSRATRVRALPAAS